MPVRELLARALRDRLALLLEHQSGRALRDQRLERRAVDQVERIEDVALRLRHLLAFLVADDRVDVDVAERDFAGEVGRHHDHPDDPEEDDVEAGDQHRRGQERAQLAACPAGQPSVEWHHSADENQVSSTSSSCSERAGSRPSFAAPACAPRLVARDVDIARARRTTPESGGPTRAGARCTSPGRCRSSCMYVDSPFARARSGRSRRRSAASAIGQARRSTAARHRSWIDLPGKNGCDAGAGLVIATNHWSVSIGSTTLAGAARSAARPSCAASRLTTSPAAREVGQHRLARDVAVEAAILRRRVVVDLRLEVEDPSGSSTVPLADLPVVEVVRRRDLHAAGAEFLVDVVVGDDRDRAPGERQRDLLADETRVALVVRIHGDRHVAQHRLRSRRRDDETPGAIGERIANLPQLALLLLACRLRGRTPPCRASGPS